jgi:hypothetical protein
VAAPGSKHADWMPILPKIVPEVIKRLPLKVAAIALAGIVASGALAVYFVPQLIGLNGGLTERGPLAGLTNTELRERATSVARSWRAVEERYDKNVARALEEHRARLAKLTTDEQRKEEFERGSSELTRMSRELHAEFGAQYQAEAAVIANEFARRLDDSQLIPPPNYPGGRISFTVGQDVFNGRISGLHPLSSAANLLDFWATKLP